MARFLAFLGVLIFSTLCAFECENIKNNDKDGGFGEVIGNYNLKSEDLIIETSGNAEHKVETYFLKKDKKKKNFYIERYETSDRIIAESVTDKINFLNY